MGIHAEQAPNLTNAAMVQLSSKQRIERINLATAEIRGVKPYWNERILAETPINVTLRENLKKFLSRVENATKNYDVKIEGHKEEVDLLKNNLKELCRIATKIAGGIRSEPHRFKTHIEIKKILENIDKVKGHILELRKIPESGRGGRQNPLDTAVQSNRSMVLQRLPEKANKLLEECGKLNPDLIDVQFSNVLGAAQVIGEALKVLPTQNFSLQNKALSKVRQQIGILKRGHTLNEKEFPQKLRPLVLLMNGISEQIDHRNMGNRPGKRVEE